MKKFCFLFLLSALSHLLGCTADPPEEILETQWACNDIIITQAKLDLDSGQEHYFGVRFTYENLLPDRRYEVRYGEKTIFEGGPHNASRCVLQINLDPSLPESNASAGDVDFSIPEGYLTIDVVWTYEEEKQ